LNKIRKKKMVLKGRVCEVVGKSKAVQDLLSDCISLEDAKNI